MCMYYNVVSMCVCGVCFLTVSAIYFPIHPIHDPPRAYVRGTYIEVGEIKLDSFHVYMERTQNKEDGLNLWAALGIEKNEEVKPTKSYFTMLHYTLLY